MTGSTGVAIKVQKAMKERKERVMTRSRARAVSEPLFSHPELTGAKGPAPSSGLKRAAPNKHGESSDHGPKDARKSKSTVSCHKRTKSINSLGREAEETASGDERVDSLIAAHDLMRVAAVTHQLTLQCAKWRKEAEEKERVLAEVRARHAVLERQLGDLRGWSEEAEQALLKAKLEIEILEQRGRDSFNAGRAAGMLEMAASDEYRAAIRRAAMSGIKEYLRSSTFEMLWAAKTAEHEAIGFMRCRSRTLDLGGFKEGFDLRLLDSLDPPVAAVDDDVEFGDLGDRKYVINK